jgi:hypothetical protein
MRQPNSLPLSPVHAAALEHIADLRRDAQRSQLARAARVRASYDRGRTPAWPAAVVVALRERLVRHGEPCPTC